MFSWLEHRRRTVRREFVERYGERLHSEVGEHSNVLNLLGMSEFRTAMFLDSSDRRCFGLNCACRYTGHSLGEFCHFERVSHCHSGQAFHCHS